MVTFIPLFTPFAHSPVVLSAVGRGQSELWPQGCEILPCPCLVKDKEINAVEIMFRQACLTLRSCKQERDPVCLPAKRLSVKKCGRPSVSAFLRTSTAYT